VGRAGCACVVAALASGCLQAPPVASGDAGSDSSDGNDGDILLFPPAEASVRIEAALAADVDGDEREDLVLVDSDVDDGWAGLYILRAGPDGWTGIDEVELGFRPHAARFAHLLRASGPALAIGGNGGKVALVDYKGDAGYEVVPLDFDVPAEGDAIEFIHSGLFDAADPRASLLLYDGIALYQSTPVDEDSPMQLAELQSGSHLDAVFWPLDSTDPTKYIVARRADDLAWYAESGSDGDTADAATAARFGHVETGLCGTHLVVRVDQSLAIGSVECDGTASSTMPLVGDDLDEIVAMASGDLAGTTRSDVALIGFAGGSLVGEILIDVRSSTDEYTADAVTEQIAVDGVTPPDIFLTPVDAEGDGSALVVAVTPDGDIDCAWAKEATVEPCPGRWQVRSH